VPTADTAHPATQNPGFGDKDQATRGIRPNLCLNDVATRCHSFFTQRKVKEVFTWQNKVPMADTSKLGHTYCCR